MLKVRITVLRKASYLDLMEQYENPLDNPCDMVEGKVFISENALMPEGFCESAWETLLPFVKILSQGGGHFYGEWMKNPHSALLSCNDGFRPVSFLVETVQDET
ncbi:MAG: TIGR04076 family protein [Lentisphaerae bacterium]|nr:TIGR04076 family protein [Lentisphaerota bacterium]